MPVSIVIIQNRNSDSYEDVDIIAEINSKIVVIKFSTTKMFTTYLSGLKY